MKKTKKEILADPLLMKGHRHVDRAYVEVLCPQCGGYGILHDDSYTDCEFCGGSGVIEAHK